MEIPESRWKRVLGSPPQRIKVVQPRIVHGRNCERSICDPEIARTARNLCQSLSLVQKVTSSRTRKSQNDKRPRKQIDLTTKRLIPQKRLTICSAVTSNARPI